MNLVLWEQQSLCIPKKKKLEEEEVEGGGTKLPVFLVFLLQL
jgi:hypothetical protein